MLKNKKSLLIAKSNKILTFCTHSDILAASTIDNQDKFIYILIYTYVSSQPSYWDLKRRQIGYMFPFLTQNPGPANDATATRVIRLTCCLYGFSLLFDLVVVWGQDALGTGSFAVALLR